MLSPCVWRKSADVRACTSVSFIDVVAANVEMRVLLNIDLMPASTPNKYCVFFALPSLL